MKEGREVLDFLLSERAPEERERLARAWERFAGGDPDSLPALYALADRFSLDTHAALLAEIEAVREQTGRLAREIGDGAHSIVGSAGKAAADSAGSVARLEKLVARFEESARLQESTRPKHSRLVGACVLAAFIAAVAGWFAGGEMRVRGERERIGAMIDRWEAGEGKAYRELMAYLGDYRKRHEKE